MYMLLLPIHLHGTNIFQQKLIYWHFGQIVLRPIATAGSHSLSISRQYEDKVLNR